MKKTKKKTAIFLLSVLAIGGIALPGLFPEKALAASNEQTVYNYLTKKIGLNSAAACGVMANIEAESDFDPNAKGDKKDGVYTSYGICQWHDGSEVKRLTALKSWCKENDYDYKTLNGQLHYLKQELSANDSDWLWNGKTIYTYLSDKDNVPNTGDGAWEAGRYWCYVYEVPANREKESQKRGDMARNTYWPVYGTGKKSSASSNSASAGTADASISIKNAVYPKKIKKGTAFTIGGTITSGRKLTKVRAVIYNQKGKVMTEASAKPGARTYRLADSKVDNNLLISKLKAGKYTYVLEASNASKDVQLLEKTFTVVEK